MRTPPVRVRLRAQRDAGKRASPTFRGQTSAALLHHKQLLKKKRSIRCGASVVQNYQGQGPRQSGMPYAHIGYMSAGYNCVGQSHHALSLCAASMFATTSPEKYGLAQLSTLATHQRPSPSTCGTHCKRASYHASPAKLASRLGDKQAPAPADVLACQRRWDGL